MGSLQDLPDQQKLLIIIVVVTIVGLGLGFFWVKAAIGHISGIGVAVKSVDFTDKLPKNQAPVSNNKPVTVKSTTPIIDTSSWEEFSKEGYPFSVKYPATLTVKEQVKLGLTSESFRDAKGTPFWFSFAGSSNSSIKAMTGLNTSDYVSVRHAKMNINNVDWYTVEGINNSVNKKNSVLNVYTTHGNTTYVFQCVNCNYSAFGNLGKDKTTTFNAIISTFTFNS
jgi:hypothetical protein